MCIHLSLLGSVKNHSLFLLYETERGNHKISRYSTEKKLFGLYKGCATNAVIFIDSAENITGGQAGHYDGENKSHVVFFTESPDGAKHHLLSRIRRLRISRRVHRAVQQKLRKRNWKCM